MPDLFGIFHFYKVKKPGQKEKKLYLLSLTKINNLIWIQQCKKGTQKVFTFCL